MGGGIVPFRHDAAKAHYCYCIAEAGREFCKIGWAVNPEKRLLELATGNPRPLYLVYTYHAASKEMAMWWERKWHNACAAHQVRSEWFHGKQSMEALRTHFGGNAHFKIHHVIGLFDNKSAMELF